MVVALLSIILMNAPFRVHVEDLQKFLRNEKSELNLSSLRVHMGRQVSSLYPPSF